MTKAEEILALADALEGNVKHWSLTVTMPQASAALREYASMLDKDTLHPGCCVHGIHMMNACGRCIPPRGTK